VRFRRTVLFQDCVASFDHLVGAGSFEQPRFPKALNQHLRVLSTRPGRSTQISYRRDRVQADEPLPPAPPRRGRDVRKRPEIIALGKSPASTNCGNKSRAEASILWPSPKQTKPICLLECMGISSTLTTLIQTTNNIDREVYRVPACGRSNFSRIT
jgi:hypothetical protein